MRVPGALYSGRLRAVAVATVLLAALAVRLLWPATPRGIVVYAAGDGAASVAQAFTRDTGIPVTVIRLFTGPMLARIAAEGGRPRWSVAWVDGDIAAAGLDRAGLLEHGVVPPLAWTPIGRMVVPANGAWIPTGVTLAGVSIRKVGNDARRNGMPDPALSGPAYPQLAAIVAASGGWPAAQGALLRLRASGLDVAPTSPAVIADLEAGRIGRAWVQSSTAFMVATHQTGFKVDPPAHPTLMPGVLMVSRGLCQSQRRDVDRFVAFVLSPAGQKVRLGSGSVDSFYWPVTQGIAAVPTMPDLAALRPVHLDPAFWAPLQADITNWFEAKVAGR